MCATEEQAPSRGPHSPARQVRPGARRGRPATSKGRSIWGRQGLHRACRSGAVSPVWVASDINGTIPFKLCLPLDSDRRCAGPRGYASRRSVPKRGIWPSSLLRWHGSSRHAPAGRQSPSAAAFRLCSGAGALGQVRSRSPLHLWSAAARHAGIRARGPTRRPFSPGDSDMARTARRGGPNTTTARAAGGESS